MKTSLVLIPEWTRMPATRSWTASFGYGLRCFRSSINPSRKIIISEIRINGDVYRFLFKSSAMKIPMPPKKGTGSLCSLIPPGLSSM